MNPAKPSSAQRHDMTAAISDALRQAESQGDMETAVALLAILRSSADSSLRANPGSSAVRRS